MTPLERSIQNRLKAAKHEERAASRFGMNSPWFKEAQAHRRAVEEELARSQGRAGEHPAQR